MGTPIRWLLARPLVVDSAMAGALFALALANLSAGVDPLGPVREPNPLAYLLVAAQTLPIAVRSLRSLAVLWVVGAATAAYGAAGFPLTAGLLAVAAAVYTVVMVERRGRASAWIAGLGIVILLAPLASKPGIRSNEFFSALLVVVVPWLIAGRMRSYREQAEYESERSARAEREDRSAAALDFEDGASEGPVVRP
jgi:hypothetical protein